MNDEIVLWKPQRGVGVPATLKKPGEIAEYAVQLTKREHAQVVQAFKGGYYEMGALFVWSKTMAALKKQLGSLGMDFIGEMLDRSDVSPQSTAAEVVTDHEAVRLAEELGMFTSVQSMRLRQVLEMVTYFSNPLEVGEDEEDLEMMPEEAIRCLRTCVQSVLGHERLEGALEFARFRKELEERTFDEENPDIHGLLRSPYFFRRTALRVLLALAKTSTSAQLEHVLANLYLIVPLLWKDLLKSDRWIIGRAYAEVHAEGKKTAASSLRRALLKVKGFDYVPEDLRSRAFLGAAARLQNVHFEMNNFHNEPAAIAALESLGTVIPLPALAPCMTAILCIRLGNHWGISWDAQETATRLLKRINESRSKYYLDECLPGDGIILEMLQDSMIAERWCEVVKENSWNKLQLEKKGPKDLVVQAAIRNKTGIRETAEKMHTRLTTRRRLA